ncbi:MAG: hypothetical protein AAF212_09755 [Verrucomicrobiota bacterium]
MIQKHTILLILTYAINFVCIYGEEITSKTWSPDLRCYGQYKLVPVSESSFYKTSTWDGPWEEYDDFFIKSFFNKSLVTKNEISFKAVSPHIGLTGENEKSKESSSKRAYMSFNKETDQSDIDIEYTNPPSKIDLEKTYLAGSMSSSHTDVTWQIYIKFTVDKSSYIKPPTK